MTIKSGSGCVFTDLGLIDFKNDITPVSLEYCEASNAIQGTMADGHKRKIADMRGWGFLTGQGGGLALTKETAMNVQKYWARAICDAYNNDKRNDEACRKLKEMKGAL